MEMGNPQIFLLYCIIVLNVNPSKDIRPQLLILNEIMNVDNLIIRRRIRLRCTLFGMFLYQTNN